MNPTRKLTFDDVWSFDSIGNVALSPDGRRVAFVVQTPDKEPDERHCAIWLFHLDDDGQLTGVPRKLTSGAKNDTNPAWSPDSRHLLFLSDREGERNQLWLIDTDGGEARKLTNMLRGVIDASWSPDGRSIAFIARVSPNDNDDVLMGRKKLSAEENKKREEYERYRLRTITTIWYRLDGRGMLNTMNQLFVMPAPSSGDTSVDPANIRRLTTDEFDYTLRQWTPDSSEISVLCNRADDRDRSWVSDLWLIDPEKGDARCLTDSTLMIGNVSWSPDGTRAIIVAELDFRIDGGAQTQLYLVSREGGDARSLTARIDNNASVAVGNAGFGAPGPYMPQWGPDGQRVYFLLTEHGRVNVQRLDIEQGTITALTNDEAVTPYLALLPNEQGLLLVKGQSLQPWEFYHLPLHDSSASEQARLTHIFDRQLAEYTWSKPERITYRGANDDEIDGWLVRPVGAREGVRYPLLVNIHGGPQSAFGVSMSLFFQYLAAQGFAVFLCNPHGSTGYGADFMREVEGDWGGWDYQDIMRGVDACIARGVADPDRLVVTGYSYGGYMSMFIIGQTDRFKAAVPMAGISNLVSFIGTSDIGFWQAAQAKGYPWQPEREAYYRERSPLTYASRVTTPTCFIHPEGDLRCPIEQSEQFYMTLKMMGKVPVEFVRSPASWHANTTKPSQYFARWQYMLDWFKKYVEIRPEEYD
jgi:dipeptidyl aminopeptidase/acylaminoacyl peptidase